MLGHSKKGKEIRVVLVHEKSAKQTGKMAFVERGFWTTWSTVCGWQCYSMASTVKVRASVIKMIKGFRSYSCLGM